MSGGFSQIDQAVGPDKSKSFKESRRFLDVMSYFSGMIRLNASGTCCGDFGDFSDKADDKIGRRSALTSGRSRVTG